MVSNTNTIEINMPVHEWLAIRKRLVELDIDSPDRFQICVNYGRLSYDLNKIKYGYWKKEKLIPENYMSIRGGRYGTNSFNKK